MPETAAHRAKLDLDKFGDEAERPNRWLVWIMHSLKVFHYITQPCCGCSSDSGFDQFLGECLRPDAQLHAHCPSRALQLSFGQSGSGSDRGSTSLGIHLKISLSFISLCCMHEYMVWKSHRIKLLFCKFMTSHEWWKCGGCKQDCLKKYIVCLKTYNNIQYCRVSQNYPPFINSYFSTNWKAIKLLLGSIWSQ